MSSPARVQQHAYRPRIQFTGTFKLLCPKCGDVNVYSIRPPNWRITCKNMHCRKVWVITFGLASPAYSTGISLTPEDMVFPVSTVPERLHRPGDPLITVLDE